MVRARFKLIPGMKTNPIGKYRIISMLRFFMITGLALAWPAMACAGEQQWCFSMRGPDGMLDPFPAQVLPLEYFSTHEPVEVHARSANGDGKALRIAWGKLGNEMLVTKQRIETYHGHDVFCFIYKQKQPAPDEPAGSFVCAMLVYADAKGRYARTFFITDGSLVDNFSVKPFVTRQFPSGIELEKGYSGTGVFMEDYTFDLTDAGPQLVESEFSGRKPPAMIYHYDNAGKVIRTEKDFSD